MYSPMLEMPNFWHLLSMTLDQDTQINFRMSGSRQGNPRWREYSMLTLHPSWKAKNSQYPEYNGKRYNPDKWNRRPGTDGAKSRRYSPSSQLLQASGMFKKSFTVLEIRSDMMKYGTYHERAKGIIGDRPVLFVTGSDEQRYSRMFTQFMQHYYRINNK